jgi:transposase-like protein
VKWVGVGREEGMNGTLLSVWWKEYRERAQQAEVWKSGIESPAVEVIELKGPFGTLKSRGWVLEISQVPRDSRKAVTWILHSRLVTPYRPML